MTNPWKLPARQAEIMTLIASDGLTSKEIGRHLGVSYKTIEVQIYRAIDKMEARSRIQAAVLWDRWARGKA